MAKARTRSDDGIIGWLPYAYSEADTARLLRMSGPQVKTLIVSGQLRAKVIDGQFVVRRSCIESFQLQAANAAGGGQPWPLPKPSSAGTVYVIGFGPYVKIGYTSGPLKARLAALQTGAPEQLLVYGQLSGGIDHEYALHLRFQQLNTYGEWFRREGALAEWIDRGCPADA